MTVPFFHFTTNTITNTNMIDYVYVLAVLWLIRYLDFITRIDLFRFCSFIYVFSVVVAPHITQTIFDHKPSVIIQQYLCHIAYVANSTMNFLNNIFNRHFFLITSFQNEWTEWSNVSLHKVHSAQSAKKHFSNYYEYIPGWLACMKNSVGLTARILKHF